MRLGSGAVIVLAGATVLASVPARAQTPVPATNVDRIRQQLDSPSPLRDAVETTAPPTFRVAVSEERIDIRRFWGEPDAASPMVHPSGGPWHHEYVNMVTPDEYKGYGGIFTNGEKAVLAQQAMLSALMFKYLPGAIGSVIKSSRERAARSEVRLALDEFYASHPGTRPVAPDGTPP